MSQSVMLSPYNHIIKCTAMLSGTKKNTTTSDSEIHASAVPGLSHITALRGSERKCSVEGTHKYEPTVQKSHGEILTAK